MSHLDLSKYGITVKNVLRNASPPVLYEQALARGEGEILSTGALAARSGEKTGRSPKDKRSRRRRPRARNDNVWWGSVNVPLSDERTFQINRQRAIDFLNTRDQLYVRRRVRGLGPERYRLKSRA